jgi:aerobic-type carbon monoxide dehydrogenase small subunit (CoxS/CutS family)
VDRGTMVGDQETPAMPDTIEFHLNGRPVSLSVDGHRDLLWVLRTDLGVTGPKYGCGIEQCGACTVLVDHRAVRSCSVPAKSVQGKSVVTIEGLEENGKLHPIQEAFIAHDALQCGFCTPGMILTAYDFLRRHPKPTRDEVVAGMDNNLCRCGAHLRIVDAVMDAAASMGGGGEP